MKNCIYIILILFCGIMVSCNDSNDDSEMSLSYDALSQTAWEGTITKFDYVFKTEETYTAVFRFITSTTAEFVYRSGNTYYNDVFTYKLEGKILTWEPISLMSGSYFIKEFRKDKFVLENYGQDGKYVLDLHYKE